MFGFSSSYVEWFISLLIYNITNEGQKLGVLWVFMVSSQMAGENSEFFRETWSALS